ncbi:hypothetical protein ACFV8T_01990 [Streptomyces sp. NPDC059832]|uniref:hypothetical protein n=1 Tax=Streptomyces sp. NPDC059832 TaxID=3346966 RepID=UPI00364E72D5
MAVRLHAAETVPGRPAELLAALRVPRVPTGARRGETPAVPVGARAVHWLALVTIEPTPLFPIAVEVELTPKSTATIRGGRRRGRWSEDLSPISHRSGAGTASRTWWPEPG